MSQEETNFNYFLGGIALMSTIFSLVAYLRTYLPRSQMKNLDCVLQETRQLYDKSVAEGLLPGHFKSKYLWKLSMLENYQEKCREQAYCARTVFSQYKALFYGLSTQIQKVYDDADQLRAQVVTTSEGTKRRRRGMTRVDLGTTNRSYPSLEGMAHESEHLSARNTEDLREDDQKYSSLSGKLLSCWNFQVTSCPWYLRWSRKSSSSHSSDGFSRDFEANAEMNIVESVSETADRHFTERPTHAGFLLAKPPPSYSSNRLSYSTPTSLRLSAASTTQPYCRGIQPSSRTCTCPSFIPGYSAVCKCLAVHE